MRNAQSGNRWPSKLPTVSPSDATNWWTGRHVLESWAAMLKAGNMLEMCAISMFAVCRSWQTDFWAFAPEVEPKMLRRKLLCIEHGRICRIWMWIIESRANYLPDLTRIYNAFTRDTVATSGFALIRFPLLRIRMSQRPRPKLSSRHLGRAP